MRGHEFPMSLRPLLLGILVASNCGCVQAAESPNQQTSVRVESPPTPPPPVSQESTGLRELAVYALSRGKGVPNEARSALTAARDLFTRLRESGQVLRIVEERMGLEGERRMCAEFVDAKAAATAREQLLSLSRGADLFNIIMEPCDRVSHKQGEKS